MLFLFQALSAQGREAVCGTLNTGTRLVRLPIDLV